MHDLNGFVLDGISRHLVEDFKRNTRCCRGLFQCSAYLFIRAVPRQRCPEICVSIDAHQRNSCSTTQHSMEKCFRVLGHSANCHSGTNRTLRAFSPESLHGQRSEADKGLRQNALSSRRPFSAMMDP